MGTDTGRILALDVGTKRIGLAVSDETAMLAQPHSTLQRGKVGFARILDLVSELGVQKVVVGLPLLLDGSEGEQAADARQFAAKLKAKRPDMDVVLWDERLSTIEARERMTGRRKQKHQVDAIAAAVILESYLNRGP